VVSFKRAPTQQGLSSANRFGALAELGGAADKRYSLALLIQLSSEIKNAI
jgi:hypothetical protein